MRMEKLNLEKETDYIVNWIKRYFVENGNEKTKAVIGISGGKDSTVCAAACIKALGVDRVVGVLLPSCPPHTTMENNQIYKESMDVINALGIKEYYTFNIYNACQSIYDECMNSGMALNSRNIINTPARIRMTFLYAIAAQVGGRVCNTCNYSENYVGYSTKYGDHAGDFSPLHMYTVREVLEIGKHLGIPEELLNRIPADGLCGVTDEENLGFTYELLDNYLLDGIIPEYDILRLIEEKNKQNKHKLQRMPQCYRYNFMERENNNGPYRF